MNPSITAEILKKLNHRPIAYYPVYEKLMGGAESGVVLSQLMYWLSKKDKIYKTNQELENETGLNKYQIRKAKKQIKQIPFLSITKEGIPPKTFYEINWEVFEETIANTSIGEKQISKRSSRQPFKPTKGKPLNTETTQREEPKGSSRSSKTSSQNKTKLKKLKKNEIPVKGYKKPADIKPSAKINRMIKYWNEQDCLPPLKEFRKLNNSEMQTKTYKKVLILCKEFLNGSIYKNGHAVLPDKKFLKKVNINSLDYALFGFQDYVDNLVKILSDRSFVQPVSFRERVTMEKFLGGNSFTRTPSILLVYCVLPPRIKRKNKNDQKDINWMIGVYTDSIDKERKIKANDIVAFDDFLTWAFIYFGKWEKGTPYLRKKVKFGKGNEKFYKPIRSYVFGAIKDIWKEKKVSPNLFRTEMLQDKVDKYIRKLGMY